MSTMTEAEKLQLANLGELQKLPAEIRLIIWNEIIQLILSSHQNDPHKDFSILRTCRQIYQEAVHLLYKNETIIFEISTKCDAANWINIDHSGKELQFEFPGTTVKGGLRHFRYDLLSEVNIEIEAPDPKDPGQVICLFQKVRALVTFLSRRRYAKLQRLRIYLKDKGDVCWMKGGDEVAPTSIREEGKEELFDPDYMTVLLEFCRLRNMEKPRFNASSTVAKSFGPFMKTMGAVMLRKESWGQGQRTDGLPYWSDKKFQEKMDIHFSQLDKALDTCPGQTARMLRLLRFTQWYKNQWDSDSTYINQLCRISKSLPSHPSTQKPGIIAERYLYMRVYRYLLFDGMSKAQQLLEEGNRKKREKSWLKWYANGIPKMDTELGVEKNQVGAIDSSVRFCKRKGVWDDWRGRADSLTERLRNVIKSGTEGGDVKVGDEGEEDEEEEEKELKKETQTQKPEKKLQPTEPPKTPENKPKKQFPTTPKKRVKKGDEEQFQKRGRRYRATQEDYERGESLMGGANGPAYMLEGLFGGL